MKWKATNHMAERITTHSAIHPPHHILSMKNKFYLLAIVILCSIAYLNSLNNQFLCDDKDLIVDNPFIKSTSNVFKSFGRGFYMSIVVPKGQGFYRPIITISYIIDYAIWKLNPTGYHITNIIFHTLCSLSVFGLAFLLYGNKKIAFLSSVVFAIHPIHTESVTWVSGRTDVISLFLYIMALIYYIKSVLSEGRKTGIVNYVFSVLFLVIALLSKEIAVTFIGIVIIYELCFGKLFKTEKIVKHIIYLGLTAGFIIVRSKIVGILTLNVKTREESLYLAILTSFKIFCKYLWTMLFPYNLSFYFSYPLAISLFEPEVFFSVIVCFIYIVILYKVYKKKRVYAFPLLWILITFAPVSNVIPINQVYAERFSYFISVGFSMIFAIVSISVLNTLDNRTEHRQLLKTVFFIFNGFLLVFYGFRTVARNVDWSDGITFWAKLINQHPYCSEAHNNLANHLLQDKKDYRNAITEYKKALVCDPKNYKVYYNLGNAYLLTGDYESAIKEYKRSLTVYKNVSVIYRNLARAYARLGRMKEALEANMQAELLDICNTETFINKGNRYAMRGEYDLALKEYRKALSQNPKNIKIYINSANVYKRKGLLDLALKNYLIALDIDPYNPFVLYNLALFYSQHGNKNIAMEYLDKALKIAPNLVPAKNLFEKLKNEDKK